MSPRKLYHSLLIGAASVTLLMSEAQADARPFEINYGFVVEFRDNAPRRQMAHEQGHWHAAPRTVINSYRTRFETLHPPFACQDEYEHRDVHSHCRQPHRQRHHAPRHPHGAPARIVDINVEVHERPVIYRSRW